MPRTRILTHFPGFLPLILVITGLTAVTMWLAGGDIASIAWLFSSDTESVRRITTIRSFFADCGAWAPLVYVACVTTEVVVAPIPGLMLYAPGGLIFGPFLGGLLALIGNILGAGIACTASRALGRQSIERFFRPESVNTVQDQLERRGVWLIFLLRVNPLTSTDLLSYAAGFTRIPVWKVMLATGCGMAPLCFLQSWVSDSLFTTFPKLIWPLAAACCVYVFAVIFVLRRILKNPTAHVLEQEKIRQG